MHLQTVFSVFKDKGISAKATVELITQPIILQENEILKAQVATADIFAYGCIIIGDKQGLICHL